MSNETKAAPEMIARASEAEALASLIEFAHGPIKAIFTWSEAATILELIETLTKSGIIEVAIRNPSVAEYMAHWEGRAEKAEQALVVERDRSIAACEAQKAIFASEEYATPQPLGGLMERFACDRCIEAIKGAE